MGEKGRGGGGELESEGRRWKQRRKGRDLIGGRVRMTWWCKTV